MFHKFEQLKQQGFTMIEILVSVIIIGTAILGIMTLQTMGLNESQGAYYKSQATILAVDIAERMRANPIAVDAGAYNNINSASVPGDPPCMSGGTACSPAEQAQVDIREWMENFRDVAQVGRDGVNWIGVIPGGTATVVGDGEAFTITITWEMSDYDEDTPGERGLVERTYELDVNL